MDWPWQEIRVGPDSWSSSLLRTKETWPFMLSGSQPRHLTAAETSFQWEQMEPCENVFSFHKGCVL